MIVKMYTEAFAIMARKEGDSYLLFNTTNSSAILVDAWMFVTLSDMYEGRDVTNYKAYKALRKTLSAIGVGV
jgi:hypothetical protein